MSDVVEKTLSALPSILPGASKLSATSKLGHLVRSITELTSKNAEERLITKELVAIKEQISSPNTTMRQMRELMVRAMYCEMLGYEASFAYIHAIKLAQQGTVLEKRVGYLAVSLFLNESHDLLLLLVNTVLKDLKSTNLIEVCMALTVVSQIFPKDMIPSILPLVEEMLYHQKEIIRRKAVLALYKFYLIAPNQVQHIHNKFRKALCDKDPGVMMCSLHIYMWMIKENPDNYKELTSSFVTILKQVVGGKLPMDFNYHSVPAPWLQIQLLRTLSLLGKEDQSMSEVMYEVLDESLRRAEMNHNISYAILYECVKAIYTIYPKAELLEKAARCIGNLVLSSKINLKYLGLKALTYVVQYDANLALQHQMTIIECLAHTDLTIKKETLELLFRITNALNVIVIVEKILGFLRLCNDNYTIIDLVGKVAELAERYSPDNKWFIQTMNTVFSLGGDFLQPDIPNNFLRLLAEGLDDEDDDRQLKIYAVDSYMAILKGDCSQLPQRFLQVISSVLGEYSCTSEGLDQREVIVLLKKLLEQRGVSSETRSWVLCALTKLCQSSGSAEMVLELAESLVLSYDTVLRQQSYELQRLSRNTQIHSQVLLQSRDSTQVDWSLSFLDGFVSEALAAGAAPYKPPHQRQEELRRQRALSLEPYGLSLPVSMPSSTLTDRQSPNLLSLSSGLSGNSTEPSLRAGVSTLVLEGVKRVWGKDGYLPQKKAPESSALANRLNSVLQSYKQEVVTHASQLESEPKREPPVDQEKQQLASSLFIGLGSQNSSFLLEKAEAPAPRFRRKYRQHRSAASSSTSEASTNSSHSSRQGTDALNDGLLEEESDTRIQISNHTLMCSTLNGSCDGMQSFTTDTYSSLEENVADIIDRPLIKSNTLTKEESVMPQNGCSDITVLQLPSELKDLPHSDVISLTSDQQLSISCCRLYREDAVLLVLFLCNITEMPLRNIFVELSCKELEMASLRGNVMEYLDGRDFSVCHYTLMIEKPHIQVTFRGSVLYQPHSGHSQSLLFSGNISTADFIRPLMLSTEEYGKLWLSSSNDVKQNLKLLTGSRGPLITTLNVFQKILRLHTVHIIGSEGIVACRLLCGAPCLMHCRVHGTSLAVWLRSPLPAFPDCLLYHCQRVLQDL